MTHKKFLKIFSFFMLMSFFLVLKGGGVKHTLMIFLFLLLLGTL